LECADAQWLIQFCIYIFSFFKFYVMYQLWCSSSNCKVWRSANGWYAYVVNGVLVGKVRYPAPGSKRWLAMLP
jgi:hypothetical protein